MSKTVGILTFHGVYNLGAVLQAFALQRAIASLGHSCKIIDYRDPADEAYRLFRAPRNRTGITVDILALLNLRSHLRSRSRYDTFRSEHLRLTEQSFRSADELACADSTFDVYLSGSDQVWRPVALDGPSARVYFQDFVSFGRRVAYAPSFGVSELPARLHARAREYLDRFEFLSAREDTGCEIIKGVTGRVAEHVLDPTLLRVAGEYDQVAVDPQFSEPYILLYPMQWSERLRDLAVRIRSSLKMPIVAVLPSFFAPWRFSFADKLIYDAGPSEFLGWVRRASFVCTNSFHGTSFSVVYRKPFLGVPHVGSGSRTHSLLNRLGLLARLVDGPGDGVCDRSMRDPLDYSRVEPRLEQAISESCGYLRRALA
jgi:hypothetical protein